MKLHELLNSLKGQVLDDAKIEQLSQGLDAYKGDFEAKQTEKYKALKTDYDANKLALEKYESEKYEGNLKAAFTKAGGNAEKFESFKKVAGKVEDIEKFDYKATLEEFKDLRNEEYEAEQPEEDGGVKTSKEDGFDPDFGLVI